MVRRFKGAHEHTNLVKPNQTCGGSNFYGILIFFLITANSQISVNMEVSSSNLVNEMRK